MAPAYAGHRYGSRITPAPYEKAQASDEEICKRAIDMAHPSEHMYVSHCIQGMKVAERLQHTKDEEYCIRSFPAARTGPFVAIIAIIWLDNR